MRGRLVKQIAGAAGLLPPRLRPVRLLFAQGRVNGVGANRHRIDGPHDDTVGLLAAVDEAGSVSAVLVDYASHPTVLGHDNVLWSADWPGAARRTLADALARLVPFPGQAAGKVGTLEEPVVLFLQGAAGDSSARFVRRGQSFAEVDRLGGLFAGQALTALLGAQDNPTTGPVVVCRRTVTVPTRAPTPLNVVAERVDQTRAEWDAVQRSQANGSAGERIARTRHEGALAALRMAETGLPPTLDLPLTVVAIGKQAWVHVPVELFASLGLRIRAESPFAHTRVVGYTDGYFGYAPDASAYEGGAYEAGVSMFDAGGSEFLCQSAIGLVHETARRASGAGSGRDAT